MRWLATERHASLAHLLTVPHGLDSHCGQFFAVDVSGQGKLSRREVLNVLVTQYPIDLDRLEANLPTLWSKWDVDGSGFINREDFVDPERGLLNWVRVHLLNEVSTIDLSEADAVEPATPTPATPTPATPTRTRTPEEWFHFCDDNNSGRLTRDQLVRALVKATRREHFEVERAITTLHTDGADHLRRLWRVPDSEKFTLAQFLGVRSQLVETAERAESSSLARAQNTVSAV